MAVSAPAELLLANRLPMSAHKSTVALPPFDCRSLPELADSSALVAGVDEVGRGALFGPVVAAAVVLPVAELDILTELGQKDSKQLSARRRVELATEIKSVVLDWQIGAAAVAEIDRINILQASLQAMRRAVLRLDVYPTVCLVDGKFPIPELPLSQVTLIKGDARSPLIAAASIIAKVWRDEQIVRLAERYPEYALASNKGYGTGAHREALRRYGPTPEHRQSFRPCRAPFVSTSP